MSINNVFCLLAIAVITGCTSDADDFHLKSYRNNPKRDTSSHILFVGHAYGHHRDTNLSLCEPIDYYLKQVVGNNTENIIFAGDVFRHATPESWVDFQTRIASYKTKSLIAIGNHDLPLRDSINLDYPMARELNASTQLILMDFDISSLSAIQPLIDFLT